MPKNIIITCGTSLFTNLLDEEFYKLSGKTFDYNDFKNFKDDIKELSEKSPLDKNIDIDCDDEMGECKIEQQIKKYLIEDGFNQIDVKSNFFKKLSAEITLVDSLINNKKLKEKGENLNIEKDNIYLFFSDTLDGQLVAEVLEYVFIEKLGIKNLKLIKIENFIVKGEGSAKIFQQQAIKNYFSQLEEIKKDGNQTIMCPVGGYKALIPYSSLYAMVQGWEIKYIYEDSDEIIDLPGGALSYFIYETGIGKNPKLTDSISKNTKYNLKEILEIQQFVNNFKKYGYINNIENISEKITGKNPAFERSLKLLKNTIDFVGINNQDLKNIKGDLKGLLKKLNNSDDIESQFLFDILGEIKDNFIDSNKIDGRFEIIKWYIGKERILEAFLILRELFIDIFSQFIFGEIKEKNNNKCEIDYRGLLETQSYILFYPNKKDSSKKYLEDLCELGNEEKNNIKELKEKIKNFENLNKLKEAYEQSKNIRNTLAHIGKQNKNFYQELNSIEKYIDILKTFKNHILNN